MSRDSEAKFPSVLQLSVQDRQVLSSVDALADKKLIGVILAKNCKTAVDFVRLAICNHAVLEWCRHNKLDLWQKKINEISKSAVFAACKFKISKQSLFDLLVVLVLINYSLLETSTEKKRVFLYIAMQLFNSFAAACQLTELSVKTFEAKGSEREILAMTESLLNYAKSSGCPGYLLLSWYYQKLGRLFLKKQGAELAASDSFYLGYQYLLTAAKLEPYCAAEIFNATYGKEPEVMKALDPCPENPESLSFEKMIKFYEKSYLSCFAERKAAANQQAQYLTKTWLGESAKSPSC